MSFAKPKVPRGIGGMMMGSPDPPLLFPADYFTTASDGLRRSDSAGATVAACSGCGSRETIFSGGRHQCAYCRADRNGGGP